MLDGKSAPVTGGGIGRAAALTFARGAPRWPPIWSCRTIAKREFGPWSCGLAERHRHTAAKHGVIVQTEIAALEYTEDHVRVRPAVMVVQPMRSVEDGQPNTIL
jgi:hypothetical protein